MSFLAKLQKAIEVLSLNSIFIPIFLRSIYATILLYATGRSQRFPKRGIFFNMGIQFFRRFFKKLMTLDLKTFVDLRKTWMNFEPVWDKSVARIESQVRVQFSDIVWSEICHLCTIEKDTIGQELRARSSPRTPNFEDLTFFCKSPRKYQGQRRVTANELDESLLMAKSDSSRRTTDSSHFSDFEVDSLLNSPLHPLTEAKDLQRNANGVPLMIKTMSQEILAEINDLKALIIDPYCLFLEKVIPLKPSDKDDVIYYIHGGAFVICNPTNYRNITSALSANTGFDCYATKYRMCPEYEFPHALEDVVTGYLYLMLELGLDAKKIHVASDSAGGNLALALTFFLQDNKVPLPKSIVCFSPFLDLTCSKKSWITNAKFDILVNPNYGGQVAPNSMYGREFVKHPYVSPFYRKDLSGLPPIMFHVSPHECLYDEITEFSGRLYAAENKHEILYYPEMPHAFQLLGLLGGDAKESLLKASEFMLRNS